MVESQPNKEKLIGELKKSFKNVFSKRTDKPIVGSDAEIFLKTNAKPIFHAPYSIPYKLRDRNQSGN